MQIGLLLCLAIELSGQAMVIPVEKTQKSLITKRTATWCPICGQPEIWPMVSNLDSELEGKALVIAGHHATSSALHRPIAKALIDNFDPVFSQPIFYFNREEIGRGGATTSSELLERSELAYQQTPQAQTGLRLSYDEQERLLLVEGRSEFYENTSGQHRVAFYLIRKSIIAYQAAQGTDTEHRNVLWDVLGSYNFGTLIDSSSQVAGGAFYHQEQYVLPDDMAANNLMVAAIIWRANGDAFDFVNVAFSDDIQALVTTATHAFPGLATFEVRPTLTTASSVIAIELSTAVPAAELELYNALGQQVQVIFKGDLPQGQHHFTVHPAHAGRYYIRFQSGAQMRTLPLIKQD